MIVCIFIRSSMESGREARASVAKVMAIVNKNRRSNNTYFDAATKSFKACLPSHSRALYEWYCSILPSMN